MKILDTRILSRQSAMLVIQKVKKKMCGLWVQPYIS